MVLRLLTYNIHKAIGTDRRYCPDRIVEILLASDADIICLQEVDFKVPRSHHDDLAHRLAEALRYHCSLGLNVFLKHGAYGNATLSRHPILHTENLNITWGIKKARGCLMSRIQTPSGEVAVLNMHLGLAGFERIRQVRMILESAFLQTVQNLPVVIAGDTNDRADKVDRLFSSRGYVDTSTIRARPAAAKKSVQLPDWRKLRNISDIQEIRSLGIPVDLQTFPSYSPFPLIRIDKVFVNDRFKILAHKVIRNARTRIASDHLPVQVDLEVI
jgi:endonuclease/exonuclease/phosphatase family metal-dependent hydrolase